MHETLTGLTNQLRGRLVRVPFDAPQVVALVLTALLAFELVHLALALWGDGPVRTSPQAPGPIAGKPVHSGVDVPSIVTAHLFGVALSEAKNDPDEAPSSTANLVLAGTLATQDPKHGFAIIGDGGPTKLYSVGDPISGASLHAVYLDHVILNRDGSFEKLFLRHQLPAGRGVVAARPVPPAPNTFVDNMGRVVGKKPGVLDSVMRTSSSLDDSGEKVRGVLVYPVADGAPLRKLGLVPGDLVTAINGMPLDDLQRNQEAFQTLKASDAPMVTVMRQGKTLTLTLNIASAAAVMGDDSAGRDAPTVD